MDLIWMCHIFVITMELGIVKSLLNLIFFSIAGASRSPTIVASYLMTITKFRWQDAIQAIRCCRSNAYPNSGFQKQLKEFDSNGLAGEVSTFHSPWEISFGIRNLILQDPLNHHYITYDKRERNFFMCCRSFKRKVSALSVLLLLQ